MAVAGIGMTRESLMPKNFLEFDGSTMNLVGFRYLENDCIIYYVDVQRRTIFAKSPSFFTKNNIGSDLVHSVEVKDRMILDPDFIGKFSGRQNNSLVFRSYNNGEAYICKY